MYRQQQFENLVSGKRILIAGYGREGRSTHALLRRMVPEESITIAENDREAAVALKKGFDLVVKSPGIPMMRFDGLCDMNCITSQCDLFMQVYGDKVVGVTGTKGKSTTASLIHHVLKQGSPKGRNVLLAGNIGIPLFDIVEQLDEGDIVVAELSCHQLEGIHRAPHIGVILNLYQEHLDHYRDLHGYQMAKMQMMLRQQNGDHCYYCSDCETLMQMVEELRPQVVSQLHPYSIEDAYKSGCGDMVSPLRGEHNLSNIFVAYQVAELMGVDRSRFEQALASFQGLPHRLERVGTFRGITFYNDSISTTPESTIAALKALQEVDTLILGGYDRGIDYLPLYRFLKENDRLSAPVVNIVFVGKAGKRMLQEMGKDATTGLNILQCDDYNAIVQWCYQHTKQGRICLLSPAAASYDGFKNFEERGETFKKIIKRQA